MQTIVRDLPAVTWCADCTDDVALIREAGYRGQQVIYLAETRRAGRDVCGRHADMHDDLAADLAAEADLLALVDATVWAGQAEIDADIDAALAEIDAAWAVAS